jgi:hypothetical protein
MSNPMHSSRGKNESEDTRSRNLFEMMHQGSHGHVHDGRKGLFASMNQGTLKGKPGMPRPGKCAPSVARSMKQPGK